MSHIASFTTSCTARISWRAAAPTAIAPTSAPSSSASARNSGMWIRNSTRSATTRASATSGSPAEPLRGSVERSDHRGGAHRGAAQARAFLHVALERGQEAIAPGADRARGQRVEHRLPTRDPLGEGHGQASVQRVRKAVEIEGVDDQRGLELARGAREAGEDENAGIFRVLRGDVFLGDEVHAVA